MYLAHCLLALLFLVPLLEAAGPRKVIYIDDGNWDSPQTSIIGAANAGFNVIILAFYMHTGPSDFLTAWEGLSSSTKQSTISTIHSKGAVLLVSFGGGADGNPYTLDAYTTGQTVGKYAKAQYLDGVDFDLENFDQGFTVNGHSAAWTIDWCKNITYGALNGFGQGAVLTHAPQSPYFGPVGATNTWAGSSGGYTGVYNEIKDILTFFNVQFYNQGSSCYVTYSSLFENGAGSCGLPGSSVMEIFKAGVPLNAIVVGKPVHPDDAGDGYVAPATLNSWFQTANSSFGWNAGIMGWEWTDDGTTAAWLKEIYYFFFVKSIKYKQKKKKKKKKKF
jgi:chitinase